MANRPKHIREEKTIDRLERENRELKGLCRSLQKRLKKVSKGYNQFLEEDGIEETSAALTKVTAELEKICFDCGIGSMIKVDLGTRYYRACNNCTRRTKSKTKENI